ncbi:MAG: hypothetical protein GY711_07650 [bacterium]|nr:hypothetical protein [bacterium]
MANTLLGAAREAWSKRHYYQLYTEVDELESFLDDYGARYNQTYSYLTELIASMRSFSLAGLSIEHLYRRIEGYAVLESLDEAEAENAMRDLRRSRAFVHRSLSAFLIGFRAEVEALGVERSEDSLDGELDEEVVRFRLPRNVDQEDIVDEEQRIAEVATKYLQACTMLVDIGVKRLDREDERAQLLGRRCTEEHARVYEATVHNLQSAYDTHIKNTVLEANDGRLVRLRGHISAVLHYLEAATQLTHFVERHESGGRSEAAEQRLAKLVSRKDIHKQVLNTLLYWADRLMRLGSPLAEALLPTYTNVQVLEVSAADGVVVHARPASLIVAIVNHHGTPVEMEVNGQTCSAGSILELMILVGSHPHERRFVFRGDEHPLRDIGILFEHDLGENGIDALPAELGYLRGDGA